jgi:mRNA-degrading endonuclease RelE of RelBE toxin-antitoxin system
MRNYEIKPYLQDVLNKLSKKDMVMYERVMKKIEEILTIEDIEHYKNLRYDMKDQKRVHLGHFVLIFKFLKESNTISFMDFGHHDEVYERVQNNNPK